MYFVALEGSSTFEPMTRGHSNSMYRNTHKTKFRIQARLIYKSERFCMLSQQMLVLQIGIYTVVEHVSIVYSKIEKMAHMILRNKHVATLNVYLVHILLITQEMLSQQ